MAKQILKRSIFLWVFSAVLVAVLLVLMLSRPLFRGATSFGFADANKVCRLTFEQGEQRVQLSKRRARWFIKGGEEAQQDKVVDVLYALQMLEVKYPLPAVLTDSLRCGGLQVTVSSRLGSLRSYTLYRVDTLTVGVVRKGEPYVLQVRGNDGLDLLSMLSANVLSWRKTLLINLLPTQIASVTVEDLGKPERSFTLSLDTLGTAKLLTLYSGKEFTNLNRERVKRYLSYFRGLSFERYAAELSKEETEAVLLGDAAYMFTIVSHSGAVQVIKLFYMPMGDELDAFGRSTEVDLNRCYLQQDDDVNVAVALWVDFDILIKSVSFFVE